MACTDQVRLDGQFFFNTTKEYKKEEEYFESKLVYRLSNSKHISCNH